MSFSRRRGRGRAFIATEGAGSKSNSYPLSLPSHEHDIGGKQNASDSEGGDRPMSLAEASKRGDVSSSDSDSEDAAFRRPYNRVREKSSFIRSRDNVVSGGITLHGVWLAAYLGDLGMLKDACSEDPDMMNERLRRADNKTPIMLAAQVGAVECFDWLMENGAATNCKDVFGRTALMLAAKYNFADIVRKLLRRDTQLIHALSEHNLDALMYAVESGSLEAVQVLMEHSPQMDTMATGGEHFGRTVMDIAKAREGENLNGLEIVRVLKGLKVMSSISKAAKRSAKRRISGTAQSILIEAMNFNGGSSGSRK